MNNAEKVGLVFFMIGLFGIFSNNTTFLQETVAFVVTTVGLVMFLFLGNKS